MAFRVITNEAEFIKQCDITGCSFPRVRDAEVLAQHIRIGGTAAPNRIAYQAMEGCDGTETGAPGELTRRKYLRFAEAGPGIIWMEATAVCREGKANPRQLELTEQTKSDFARLVNDIKETAHRAGRQEPLVILQLTHSGRQSKPEGKPAPLVAYHNAVFEEHAQINDGRIITDDYLDALQERFVTAAELAVGCGFDGVDVKSCHGYLLGELLSAYTRPGKYGGSLWNRSRMLRETVAGIRSAVPAGMVVCSRLSAYDGFPYPWGFGVKPEAGIAPDFTEVTEILAALEGAGLDLVNVTMGNPYVNPHVNRPFSVGGYEPDEHPLIGVQRLLDGAARIKAAFPGMAVVSSGLSYLGAMAPEVSAGYVANGQTDIVGFGRMTLAYPEVAGDILAGCFDTKKICMLCSKCTRLMRAGGTAGCAVRDECYIQQYKKMKEEGKLT